MSLPAQRRGEPFPCVLVARNPESQPVRGLCERAGEDSFAQELFKGGSRVGMSGQSIEVRSADDSPAGAAQESVEARASLFRRARVASNQSESASARTPIAIAGPLTGHGPRAARKDATMSGEARAKPSRSPASP